MKSCRCRVILYLLVLLCMLTGCSSINRDTKIVLTTGFTPDEIFRIESRSCYRKEVMVYLTNIQNQYEKVYGPEIWKVQKDGVSMEQSIKEEVLSQLAQIKTMNLMAEKYNVQLSERQEQRVQEAAAKYYESLNDRELELLGVSSDTILQLYREYALAGAVYDYIIQDVNPEISDDEARTISLEQILIRPDGENPDGEQAKREARELAQSLLLRAQGGEDFETLMSEYNQAETGQVSFGKGEMASDFERAAFELGKDEISSVLETDEGYYILKCISTYDKAQTDINKEKIIERQKRQAFSKEYDSFVETLTRNMNTTLWEDVTFLHDPQVTTSDFFEIYDGK